LKPSIFLSLSNNYCFPFSFPFKQLKLPISSRPCLNTWSTLHDKNGETHRLTAFCIRRSSHFVTHQYRS
jgi:hypothetical protein